MAESGIYEIVNLVNGKRYVGSALKFRMRWHKHRCELRKQRHHSKHLQNAWNKYGAEAFEFRVIEWCGRDALLEREQFHIDQGCEYNKCLVAGSPLGVKHSEEARQRMSERRRGRTLSDGHAAKLAQASRDRWQSEEYRERLSASIAASYDDDLRELRGRQSRERWADPEFRERMSEKSRQAHKEGRMPDLGAMSRERWKDSGYREKMIRMLKDRPPMSEEQRRRIAATLTGRKMPVETKRKKNKLTDHQAEDVLRLRLSGKHYAEIATAFSVSQICIARICRGERYAWVAPHLPRIIDVSRRKNV